MNMGTVTSSLLAPLLGNQCKVVVLTPLAACNASLASVTGTLTAPVQLLGIDSGSGSGSGGLGGLDGLIGLIGQIVGGLLGGILNIIPLAFFVASSRAPEPPSFLSPSPRTELKRSSGAGAGAGAVEETEKGEEE